MELNKRRIILHYSHVFKIKYYNDEPVWNDGVLFVYLILKPFIPPCYTYVMHAEIYSMCDTFRHTTSKCVYYLGRGSNVISPYQIHI